MIRSIIICLLLTLQRSFSMRLIVQRVHSASVSVEGTEVSRIGPGILALVGLTHSDELCDVKDCCRQLVKLKLWDNENGKPWRLSVQQTQYEILLVSQFTLYGTISKSKFTPDYRDAMKSVPAKDLYEQFVAMVEAELPGKVQNGVFGAMMNVELNNDGPVTLLIESATPHSTTNGGDNV